MDSHHCRTHHSVLLSYLLHSLPLHPLLPPLRLLNFFSLLTRSAILRLSS